MSETDAPVEGIEAEAEAMGWIPKERYKGPPEAFVEADEYVRKGKEILPLLRKTTVDLRTELAQVRSQQAATAAALAQAQAAIAEQEERHTVATQKAIQKAKAEVKAQLAEASRQGDHEGVAELTEQMTQLQLATEEKVPEPAAPPPIQIPPEMQLFHKENPWFSVDRAKTRRLTLVCDEMRDEGITTIGKPFLDAAVARMNEQFYPAAPSRPSKVEADAGGRPSGGSRGKGYADMPAEARMACDQEAKQFVGKGKKYQTTAEWRDAYARIYHEE